MQQLGERLNSMMLMIRNITLQNEERFLQVFNEHIRIIDALLAGDSDLAGAFDPVHSGHLHLCEAIFKALKLDKILLVPSFAPVHRKKPLVASFGDRLEMCRIAVQGDNRYMVEDIEGSLYSTGFFCDTLKHYALSTGDLYLILGPDAYMGLGGWKNSEHIIKTAALCTLPGRGASLEELRRQEAEYGCQGGRSVILETEALPVSSSQIRRDFDGSREFLPSGVREYIGKLQLY
jgi:nicotinate-nucleotide adenylyltransferase